MANAHDFIDFALSEQVLKFGDFTLKSGRQSPYFFNAGLFHQGENLKRLGAFYANRIIEANISFDILFGPAYKGIPIATATAIALSERGINIDVAFNRKEAKTHGEKGVLIGAALDNKKVLMIDDVITAGTAFREALDIITQANAALCGVVIALDRQEKGQNNTSAIDEIEKTHNIPVVSIAKLNDIKAYLKTHGEQNKLKAIEHYQANYGI